MGVPPAASRNAYCLPAASQPAASSTAAAGPLPPQQLRQTLQTIAPLAVCCATHCFAAASMPSCTFPLRTPPARVTCGPGLGFLISLPACPACLVCLPGLHRTAVS